MTSRLLPTGDPGLDEVLRGGLPQGSAHLVQAPPGAGKTTPALQVPMEGARHGERVALLLFEERLETFLRRCEGLGMELTGHVEGGRLKVLDRSPDEVTPGEFGQIVLAEAEAGGRGTVVIASLTGHTASPADEAHALFDIQSLTTFLARREVPTIVIVGQRGLLGADEGGPRLDPSFLGGRVLLLRMHEDGHAARRSIAPVKKRHGPHVMDICELVLRPDGIAVEQPPEAPS